MKRLLQIIELVLTRWWIAAWPSKMPGWFEEIWAGVLLVFINAIRRVWIGAKCDECQGCGLVYPLDDLHDETFRDGSVLPQCIGCTRFYNMIRGMAPHLRPKAA
jgi:hypothetical protein